MRAAVAESPCCPSVIPSVQPGQYHHASPRVLTARHAQEWYYPLLKPWQHYVPVWANDSGVGIAEAVDWANDHPDEVSMLDAVREVQLAEKALLSTAHEALDRSKAWLLQSFWGSCFHVLHHGRRCCASVPIEPQTHCPLWCVCIAQAMGVRMQVWGLGIGDWSMPPWIQLASAHLGKTADSHGKLSLPGPHARINHTQGAAGMCSNPSRVVLCWLLPPFSDQQHLMQATRPSMTAPLEYRARCTLLDLHTG